MKELTQIRDAVVSALESAGLPTMAAYPHRQAQRVQNAVAAVAVGTAEGVAMGFCNYLGEAYDTESGTVRELYGKQLDGTITVEIRAEQAAACETGCETATEVLLNELPAGIRPGELRWEAISWEKETGLFLRRASLTCRAVFLAREAADGETFLDFTLKGVMKN